MKKAGTLLQLQIRSQAIYYRDECENCSQCALMVPLNPTCPLMNLNPVENCLQCALMAPLNPHLFVSVSTRDQNNASAIVAHKMNQIQNKILKLLQCKI